MDQDQNIEIGTNASPLFVFETNKFCLWLKKILKKKKIQ
jgi:hypothetical protein